MAPHAKPLRSIRASHYLFGAVLLVRLIGLTRLSASPFLLPSRGDMHFYDDWAQRILHGQWTDHLAFYGLPLYAYLLAGLYKLAGYNPFVPGLLQAVIEAGTAVLIYKIGTRIFRPCAAGSFSPSQSRLVFENRGELIGAFAAFGWALFVPAQAYSVVLMPTTWLVFVFWFVVWRVVRDERSWSVAGCFSLGLLIGFTAMGIATIFFIVPLLLAAVVLRPATGSWGKGGFVRIGAITMLFAGIIAGTAPCWIHNYFVARDPVFLSAHSGVNFWIGNNPVANGYPRIPPGLHAGQSAMLQDSISVAEAEAGHPLPRSEVSAFWSAKARAYILANPTAWMTLVGLKARNFWNAFAYDDLSIITNLREHGIILPGLRFGLVAALGLAGMFLAAWQVPRSRWVAAAVLLHLASLLTVFVTERYRLAAVPGLLLFGAFALWKLWEFCVSHRYADAAGLLAAISVSTWFVSLPQRDPSLWALDAYNSGWQALESGNLPLAREKLQLAYAYVPANAEINLALGNLALERGDAATAERYYTDAVRIEPTHKAALSNLAVLALQQHQPERAANLLRAAMKSGAAEAKTHYLLARAEYDLGHHDVALPEIEAAVRLNPQQHEFVEFRDRIRAERSAAPD